MAEINITLLSNRQNIQENADDLKIVAGENRVTTIAVEFPGDLAAYSKRVDFMNSRGEKWIEALYTPEDERNEYPPTFDKSNFTFTLPDAITIPGELLVQFMAYVPGTQQTLTFELIRFTVEEFIGCCRKRAPRNPDLIVKAYEYSNKALDIARDSLARTLDSEQAASDAAASAAAAQQSAANAEASSGAAQASSNASAVSAAEALAYAQASATSASAAATSAANANTRATNAETAAGQAAADVASANTRATNAETAASNSADSASVAQGSASTAATQATNSASLASQAATSASQAQMQATNAATSAAEAAMSAQLAVDQTGTKVIVKDEVQGTLVLLDLIYPIGSIYMSANNVSPQTFIGGTWAAWGMGRVPLGIGTPQANNDGLNTTTPSNSYVSPEVRGGLENSTAPHTHSTPNHTHTLSVSVAHTWTSSGAGTSGNQSVGHTHTTPDHIHSFMAHSRASGNVSSIAGGNSNNNSTLGGPDTAGSGNSARTTYIGGSGNISGSSGGGTTGGISANHTHTTPNHTHTLSSTATPSWTSSGTGTSGDSSVLSTRGNLQPYITCYMWKRTN